MKNVSLLLLAAVVFPLMTPNTAEARVVRFVVEQIRPFADGKSFGEVGPYVRLEGRADLEVDPKDPLNALIVNLDKAPRNARGMVDFRTRFAIIKPVEMRRGNQKILYGINNRGNPIELPFHQFPTAGSNGPEGGDGLMFRLGYTVVDAGWAGDLVSTPTRLGAELPVAVQPDGRPIVARVRVEYEEEDLSGYTSRQDQKPDFLSYSYPPLTYAVTTDPISGLRDGLLKRPATDPLVLHVDSANEFWQMNASLSVHDGRGNAVPVPDNVRLYSLDSHSHGGASGVANIPTTKGICRYPVNGTSSYNPLLRALLVVLDDWADRGIAPPKSQYSDVRDGTLVTLEEAGKSFPSIPGVTLPTVLNELTVLDYGPKFGPTGGWLTQLPPKRSARYQVRVPKPDRDGLDLGGVRTVDVAVPVGTNTGWNLIAAQPRGTDLCGLSGAFFPFAKTKADRLASGDPRLSLEERYKTHAGFVSAVQEAAHRLVKERLLLDEDARRLVQIAEESSILK